MSSVAQKEKVSGGHRSVVQWKMQRNHQVGRGTLMSNMQKGFGLTTLVQDPANTDVAPAP